MIVHPPTDQLQRVFRGDGPVLSNPVPTDSRVPDEDPTIDGCTGDRAITGQLAD